MDYVPAMYATFWALVPPVVAIVLALITKEVYSSLFLGLSLIHIFQENPPCCTFWEVWISQQKGKSLSREQNYLP